MSINYIKFFPITTLTERNIYKRVSPNNTTKQKTNNAFKSISYYAFLLHFMKHTIETCSDLLQVLYVNLRTFG